MSEDNGIYLSLLLEFYGTLLTERQREMVGYAVNEDLSLSEIAELSGITRQGVGEAIRKATAQLEDYEAKLGMYAAFCRRQKEGERLLSLIRSSAVDPDRLPEIEALLGSICG